MDLKGKPEGEGSRLDSVRCQREEGNIGKELRAFEELQEGGMATNENKEKDSGPLW